MTDLRHKERAKMRKYHCELWITKPDEFLIEADSIEEAKEKVAKIAAEKIKKGEKKVGQFIHEVDDDFEIESGTDAGCEMGMKDENYIGRSRRKESLLRKV